MLWKKNRTSLEKNETNAQKIFSVLMNRAWRFARIKPKGKPISNRDSSKHPTNKPTMFWNLKRYCSFVMIVIKKIKIRVFTK